MTIRIKKSTLEEIDILMAWRTRVLKEVFSIDEGSNISALIQKNEEYYKTHLQDGSHTACFAIDTDTSAIVGCGGICYQNEMPSPDNPTGSSGYIMNIYALPERRGMGIGRKIIEYLISEAKARGIGKIYLESSKMAKKLYYEIGFSDMCDYMELQKEKTK